MHSSWVYTFTLSFPFPQKERERQSEFGEFQLNTCRCNLKLQRKSGFKEMQRGCKNEDKQSS